MPVAFDAASTGSSALQTYSFTHTPVGAPTAVVVGIADVGSTVAAGESLVIGVLYGGRWMNFRRQSFISAQTYLSVWSLHDPEPGPQTVTVYLTRVLDTAAICVSVTGNAAAGPNPPNSTGASNDFDTPPITATVTSATDRMVVGFVVSGGSGAGVNNDAQVTPGAGQTQRASVSAPATDLPRLEATTEAGAASVVTNWTFTNTADWSVVGIDLDGVNIPYTPGGGQYDDRHRFRPSVFHPGQTTAADAPFGVHRSAWPDDARDFGQRDNLAGSRTRGL